MPSTGLSIRRPLGVFPAIVILSEAKDLGGIEPQWIEILRFGQDDGIGGRLRGPLAGP